jgi:hypothetical protein
MSSTITTTTRTTITTTTTTRRTRVQRTKEKKNYITRFSCSSLLFPLLCYCELSQAKVKQKPLSLKEEVEEEDAASSSSSSSLETVYIHFR